MDRVGDDPRAPAPRDLDPVHAAELIGDSARMSGLTMTLPYAILQPLMPDDPHGAMWLVCGAAVLLCIWPLRRLRRG